jgi:aldehyde:ferredoxin oxidoreductase
VLPDALADLRAEHEAAHAAGGTGRWLAAGETVESVDFADEVGVLPARGWGETGFDVDDIGAEAHAEAAVGRERAEDPVPGGFRVETERGESVPRGATPMTLGAGLGIEDFDAVVALGETCDRLGLDVISAGNAVAWAIRAGVVDVEFGDHEGARDLVERVARRADPLADAMADGVADAAARYGGADLVPTVKAMELPAYDPRGTPGMALAYATSDRGGCHRRARPIEEAVFKAEDDATDAERARLVAAAQDVRSVLWSLVADDFAGETLHADLGAAWLDALSVPHDDLRTVGERVWTLVRLFNVREGFDRADDALPEWFAEPLPEGPTPASGRSLPAERLSCLLDAYYDHREWDERGVPTPALCERLGLPAPTAVGDDESDSG